MWELDFKISKARAMREESRKARDRAVEALGLAKNSPGSEVEVNQKVTEAEAQVKGFEAQMSMIDTQINGSTGEEPVTGLMEHLEGLADLRSMYKDYSGQI